eukprot:CAMPEP_0114977488 /NCGR_PEP_ID=MMETSP0216-20121206/3265_1 /TAXON_ID=223996 /ORGANISM="Protocruzia adherens, Strain Boccale" /LENGTH=588 /DNA_ID=CAMNT_0002338551 /DNA_START=619 /DNA_END=2385 /DNA_ORIENTATION=+
MINGMRVSSPKITHILRTMEKKQMNRGFKGTETSAINENNHETSAAMSDLSTDYTSKSKDRHSKAELPSPSTPRKSKAYSRPLNYIKSEGLFLDIQPFNSPSATLTHKNTNTMQTSHSSRMMMTSSSGLRGLISPDANRHTIKPSTYIETSPGAYIESFSPRNSTTLRPRPPRNDGGDFGKITRESLKLPFHRKTVRDSLAVESNPSVRSGSNGSDIRTDTNSQGSGDLVEVGEVRHTTDFSRTAVTSSSSSTGNNFRMSATHKTGDFFKKNMVARSQKLMSNRYTKTAKFEGSKSAAEGSFPKISHQMAGSHFGDKGGLGASGRHVSPRQTLDASPSSKGCSFRSRKFIKSVNRRFSNLEGLLLRGSSTSRGATQGNHVVKEFVQAEESMNDKESLGFVRGIRPQTSANHRRLKVHGLVRSGTVKGKVPQDEPVEEDFDDDMEDEEEVVNDERASGECPQRVSYRMRFKRSKSTVEKGGVTGPRPNFSHSNNNNNNDSLERNDNSSIADEDLSHIKYDGNLVDDLAPRKSRRNFADRLNKQLEDAQDIKDLGLKQAQTHLRKQEMFESVNQNEENCLKDLVSALNDF